MQVWQLMKLKKRWVVDMKYPDFFDDVESINLFDPLSAVLGSFEGGKIEFNYVDVVKSAGHSCPTVAGAYLMTLTALKALYPDTLPVRGEIKVEFGEDESEGVAGVIANVIANITGATEKSGFKGLNGNFVRHSLMSFNSSISSSAKFTRVDSGKIVEVIYNHQVVPANPKMQPLMGKVMQQLASVEEKKEFGKLWQERVKSILIDYKDDENLIKVI